MTVVPGKLTDSSGGVAAATMAATIATQTFTIPVILSRLANAQQYQLDPGFNGKVTAINFRVGDQVVSTAAKAATLTAQANAGSVTGGVVSLTSAALGTIGAQVAGTAVTGNNTFTASQSIGCVVSGVTAFVEGDGIIEITVVNTDLAATLSQLAAAVNSLTDAVRSV